MSASFRLLGQAGVRLALGDTILYLDPYLTDHVFEVEKAPDLRRMVAPSMKPHEVRDADLILVSHIHLDHCDPTTIGPMFASSSGAKVVCPRECVAVLEKVGVSKDHIIVAKEEAVEIRPGLSLEAIPAAHPEIVRDEEGQLRFVGYVLTYENRRFYHAGDTSPAEALIRAVQRGGPIDVAFLPVNERNFYRERRGIIGNMTLREAFQLAEDIGVKTLVPVHWDMFAPNRVYPEEIQLLHQLIGPSFRLRMDDGVLDA